MIAVRYSGWTDTRGHRQITEAQCAKWRLRWTVRAQVWGIDAKGQPARFSCTLRAPKAMRLAELAGTINALLSEAAADMRAELGRAADMLHAAAGWVAVSESPARMDRGSR